MAKLKLDKLPNRNPIKLTISVLPDLKGRLDDYAALYAATYGNKEPVEALIPPMVESFLGSDRAFKAREREVKGATPEANRETQDGAVSSRQRPTLGLFPAQKDK